MVHHEEKEERAILTATELWLIDRKLKELCKAIRFGCVAKFERSTYSAEETNKKKTLVRALVFNVARRAATRKSIKIPRRK